jgi:hypothetical protein
MSSISTDFRLRLDHDVFEDNPELKIVPAFTTLTDRQMKFVMLVDWFRSPLRNMKLEDRKMKAALWAGYKYEKGGTKLDMNARNVVAGKVATIEQARREMLAIQFDFDRDLLDTVDLQIEEIKIFLKKPEKTDKELDKAIQFLKQLPILLETRVKLKAILGVREEQESVEIVTETGTIQAASMLEDYNEEQV